MTPEQKLEEAEHIERLADIVSYKPDKQKLCEQADQLRREAAHITERNTRVN